LRKKVVQNVSASEGPIVHAVPAVTVDADRDNHRDRGDAAILAHLHVWRDHALTMCVLVDIVGRRRLAGPKQTTDPRDPVLS
jgi:hypothetical protein